MPGILSGAAVGAASGGLAGGLTSSLTGGDFGEGFLNGAVSGAISGGIYGGIAAIQSRYERNLFFGNVTKSGKIDFILDLINIYSAKSQGLNLISVVDNLPPGVNAETSPVINGVEISGLDAAFATASQGTRSNIAFRYKGRSLRAIESTFIHEMVHVSDYYSGFTNKFYRMTGNNRHITRAMAEYRAYRANIAFGRKTNSYLRALQDAKQVLNVTGY